MATPSSRAQCVKCGKEKATLKCAGCSQDFCYKHLIDHRQELNVQLDEIEVNHDIFRQTLTEQTTGAKKQSVIKQIDQWEEESIRIIQQTANECRQLVLEHTTEHTNKIEINLAKLTDELRQTRQENDFDEIDLRHFKQKLTQLMEKFDKPSNISLERSSESLINKISVIVSSRQLLSSTNITMKTKWTQNGITIAGGNGKGHQLNQLFRPQGICIDDDEQHIYIADADNHRIVAWKFGANNGQVVAGGNGQGNRIEQLNQPTDVIVDKKNDSLIICDSENRRVVRWSYRNSTNGQIIIPDIDCCGLKMDNNGNLYISNCKRDEVTRWKKGDTNGTIVAGGNGKGNQLNQLNSPTYIFVDEDHSVYVTDRENHRVMKWMKDAKEGIIVAGEHSRGNSLRQLSKPQGVIVDHLGNVYVADSANHRIMRWSKGSKEVSIVVGGNGEGTQPDQFNYLRGLLFDRKGSLYVVDKDNNRVQKFHVHAN